MNSSLIGRTLRRACLAAVCVGSLSSWAQTGSASVPTSEATPRPLPPVTVTEVLNHVWQRHPDAVAARSAGRDAEALNQVSQSWTAGQPSASVAQTEGLSRLGRDQRATELGVTAPIWQWGQRSQLQEQARAWQAWADAQAQLTRWRLAADIYDKALAIYLAEAEIQQLKAQLQTMTELDADVQRRVRAGDLAPADALASQSERLSLLSQLSSAQQAWQVAQTAWRTLAGDMATPAPDAWIVAAQPIPTAIHPLLTWHATHKELARIKHRAIQDRWGAPPELALQIKQEGAGSSGYNRSASVALSVPIGRSVHRQPELATAMALVDQTEAEARQAEVQVESALQEAQAALRHMQAQTEAENQRAELLQKRADWLQKAFQAGETDLPELLRARAAAAQANASRIHKDIQRRAAQARLQLAQGNMP